MSMPHVPDIEHESDISREKTIDLLLASIMFEELGLAHVINAEAEKIQFALGSHDIDNPNEPPFFTELVTTNKSVEQVVRKVIYKEMLLSFQLEDLTELTKQDDKTPIMPESIILDNVRHQFVRHNNDNAIKQLVNMIDAINSESGTNIDREFASETIGIAGKLIDRLGG
ncbi:MAG: hypothetical protein FWE91_06495 [Defluviitaleaceae bacterium]|nr:hypothetical protein [Defluviitaleaceae bacterium]